MSKLLPLVHLSTLRPVIAGLRKRGVDPEVVLEGVGLNEVAVESDETVVHVMVIHQFVENCAKAVGDPKFCSTVASELDPTGWPMIQEALQRAGTLGDFLNIYIKGANDVATSVTAYLEVRGDKAYFGEERKFRPTIIPAQNDGFMISLALSILERTLPQFERSQVTVTVCDPSVLCERFRTIQVLKGDVMGSRIQFPSQWLSMPIHDQAPELPEGRGSVKVFDPKFLPGFRSLLRQNIGSGGLSAEMAAKLAAMSQSKLARALATRGTDISSEINAAKLEYAQDQLLHSTRSIEEISNSLGYSDPSNFARSFSKAMKQSPSLFRRNQRK